MDHLLADEQIYYDSGYETVNLLLALTDHQNRVRDLAEYNSGTDQTSALHRVMDAFGNVTSETGAAACLFGYTGKLFDEETGLQNNWNRWYDATVGKWLSEDAIWDGANLARYVGNAPLTNTDPTGLISPNQPNGPEIRPTSPKPAPEPNDSFETGDIPKPWKGWWNPWKHDREDALKDIPRLTPAEPGKPPQDGQIPRRPLIPGPGANLGGGRWGKGIVPPGSIVGPSGCGPCVGVILIPDDPTKPIIIIHFLAGVNSGSSGLDAAGAKNLKGYKAVIIGGSGGGGLLHNVIGEIKRRGGTIKGYVPGSGAGVDDKGNLYWTDPERFDDADKKEYGDWTQPPPENKCK